jgi:hypothetical protein
VRQISKKFCASILFVLSLSIVTTKEEAHWRDQTIHLKNVKKNWPGRKRKKKKEKNKLEKNAIVSEGEPGPSPDGDPAEGEMAQAEGTDEKE